jgi:hypothetical protein
MKSKLQILVILLFIFNSGWSQNENEDELERIENFKKEEKKAKAWLDIQYEWNVITKGGNTTYNKEAKKILSDSTYYQFIYPETYTWPTTLILLKKKVIKQAVWYMLNLYGMDKATNTPHIMKTIITLDQALDMEKVLLSSYYSYISFDREIVSIENGKVKEYLRPDIAEEKLSNVKELATLLMNYRKSKQDQKN